MVSKKDLPLYKVGDQTYSDYDVARVEAAKIDKPVIKTQLCIDIQKQEAARQRVKKVKAQIRQEKWNKFKARIKQTLDSFSKYIHKPQDKLVSVMMKEPK